MYSSNRPISSSLNTWALISIIVAFIPTPFVGLFAIYAGRRARREIATAPDRYKGATLAMMGIILGWVSFSISVLFLCFIVIWGAHWFVLGLTGHTGGF